MDSTDLLAISVTMIGVSALKTLHDKGIGFNQISWKPLSIAGVLVLAASAVKSRGEYP